MHPSPGPSSVTKLNVTKFVTNVIVPLVSRPIFELGQSVGPFLYPLSNQSPPNRPIKNWAHQFNPIYTRMIITPQNTYQILAAQNKRYNLMFTLKRDTTQNTHEQDLQHQKSKQLIQVAIWFQKQRSKCSRASTRPATPTIDHIGFHAQLAR